MASLHLYPKSFDELITATSRWLGLENFIIEKDYWVSNSLQLLSQSKYKDNLVFRGGISLSKCYNVLERFSEDIDLALINDNHGLSKSQIKTILKNSMNIMTEGLKECSEPVPIKSGNYRYVYYTYPSKFSNSNHYEVKDRIAIETITFGNQNPYQFKSVDFLITRFLNRLDRQDLVNKFNLNDFELNVLSLERTMTDKLASLIRMSYSECLSELYNSTRHLYDFYKTFEILNSFYSSDKFLDMISKVKSDEKISRFSEKYPYLNNWCDAPLWDLLINDSYLKESYIDHFGKTMVYGELPNYDDVIEVMMLIRKFIQEKRIFSKPFNNFKRV